jgi:hypothetical protein
MATFIKICPRLFNWSQACLQLASPPCTTNLATGFHDGHPVFAGQAWIVLGHGNHARKNRGPAGSIAGLFSISHACLDLLPYVGNDVYIVPNSKAVCAL